MTRIRIYAGLRSRIAIFLGLGLATIAAPAHAQQHVCPNGAGPDETFLGMAPGGPGIAPAPLCDWVSPEPAAQPAPPPGQWRDPPHDPKLWGDPNHKTIVPKGWGAFAQGLDKPVMASSEGKASREAAIVAAMDECRRQGATRCELVVATEIK